MCGQDARVDYVRGDALAGGVVEDVASGAGLGVAYPGQAIGGVVLLLEGGGLDVRVGLDVGDHGLGVDGVHHEVVGIEGHGAPPAHLERVDRRGQRPPVERPLVQVALGDRRLHRQLVRVDVVVAERVVVHHDVRVRHDVRILGVDVVDEDAQARSGLLRGRRLCGCRLERSGLCCESEGSQAGKDRREFRSHLEPKKETLEFLILIFLDV